jgi:hypothetical protein
MSYESVAKNPLAGGENLDPGVCSVDFAFRRDVLDADRDAIERLSVEGRRYSTFRESGLERADGMTTKPVPVRCWPPKRSGQPKEIVRQMRFENGNYVWINDLDARMILHPAIPDYEGKDMSGFRDPNGVALFVEAAWLAQAKGEGAIRNMWPRTGRKEPSPEISYVKLFPGAGWSGRSSM